MPHNRKVRVLAAALLVAMVIPSMATAQDQQGQGRLYWPTIAAGTAATADWVTTYADPAFEALATTLERLLDTYTSHADPTGDKARAIYRRAMRLELMFFDSSYGKAGG